MYSFDYKLFKRLNPFVKNKDIAEYLEVSEGYVSKVINGQTQLSEEKFTKLIEHPDWDVAPLLGRAQATTPTYPHPCNLAPTNKPTNFPTLTTTDTPQDDRVEVIEVEAVEIPLVPTAVVKQPDVRLSKWLDKYSDNVERLRLSEIINGATMVREVKEKDMCPDLKVGQYIYLEKMPKEAPIKQGHTYFVDHSKLGGFFRKLFDRGETIECRAANPAYEANIIQKEDIYDIYQVVGVFSTDIIEDTEAALKDQQIATLTEQLNRLMEQQSVHSQNTAEAIASTNRAIEQSREIVAQQGRLIEILEKKQ
jgi:predicted XRE-type DNA-binding protein